MDHISCSCVRDHILKIRKQKHYVGKATVNRTNLLNGPNFFFMVFLLTAVGAKRGQIIEPDFTE